VVESNLANENKGRNVAWIDGKMLTLAFARVLLSIKRFLKLA